MRGYIQSNAKCLATSMKFSIILIINLMFSGKIHSIHPLVRSSLIARSNQSATSDQPVEVKLAAIEQVATRFNEVKPVSSSSQRADLKCSEAENELDKCSAQMISFGQASAIYPSNMVELESQYCPNFKKAVNCVQENSRCFKPFERQIITWILSSTRRLNYKRCRNETEKAKFLRLTSSCLSSMNPSMNGCMRTYIASLEAIADLNGKVARLSADDFQIQLSCCANRQFKKCVMNSAKQMCRPQDGHRKLQRTNSVSSRRTVERYIGRVSSAMVDELGNTLDKMTLTGPEFICKNVDDDFCESRYSGRFRGRTSRHKSILPAMLQIYSNQPQ